MKIKLLIVFLNFFLCIKSSSLNGSEIFHNNNKTSININSNNSQKNKKNVILGVIQGYSISKVLTFFKSLIKANISNCDIVIFVRNVSKIIIDYLHSIGVIVYEIPNKYKNIIIINIRWKMYIDFLERNKNKYKLILHCDIRDTFFQKDIFKYYENHEPFLGVSIEDGTLNENVNKGWIINFVGDKKYKMIKNERIICIGSIWGTIDKFLDFSIYFWNKLIKNPYSIEQGIANYIFYYEKMFNNFIIKSDNYGPIMTIGLTKKEKIIIDSNDNILNFQGEVAAVIHQYDRKVDIVKRIKKKYCPELLYYEKIINDNNEFNKKNKLNEIKCIYKKIKNIIYLLFYLYFFSILLIIKIRNIKIFYF